MREKKRKTERADRSHDPSVELYRKNYTATLYCVMWLSFIAIAFKYGQQLFRIVLQCE